ncbi:hypothetical protein A2U01_0060977, partial [Trifolium medium]|nr:hypothetical protein [Trifolium medium]
VASVFGCLRDDVKWEVKWRQSSLQESIDPGADSYTNSWHPSREWWEIACN